MLNHEAYCFAVNWLELWFETLAFESKQQIHNSFPHSAQVSWIENKPELLFFELTTPNLRGHPVCIMTRNTATATYCSFLKADDKQVSSG